LEVSRIGFILKPDKSQAGVLLEDLVPWIRSLGHVPVVTTEDQIAPAGCEIVPEDELAANIDFAVVLGGDGTMLRASRLVADAKKPVLGVNLGQLGFLTSFAAKDARASIQKALTGELSILERTRMEVRFTRAAGQSRSESASGANTGNVVEREGTVVRTALNDAVIHQGAMARLVDIDAWLDSQFVAAYKADGLIVATPTGSTAYSMAAGGPIVVPGQSAMIMTPICAHALTHRPLVVPARSSIKLTLGSDARGVVLTVDGQWAHSFLPGDEVTITAAITPLRLFQSGESFFDIMRGKLQWGLRLG
jgi:NAD+ kinase